MLHQAQNPPIAQAITEELNKSGYGEFKTETELNEAIAGIETGGGAELTTEQINKLNELLPYTIGAPINHTGATWPNIPVIKTDGVCEFSKYIDFHGSSADNQDFTARLSCEASQQLNFDGNLILTKLNGNNLNNNTWSFVPFVNSNGYMNTGRRIQMRPTTGNSSPVELVATTGQLELINNANFKTEYLHVDDVANIANLSAHVENGPLNVITNNNDGNLIATFNNNLTTQFFGEISTPTFNSNNVNIKITNLEEKTQLIASVDPVTELTTFNGSITSDNITTITNKVHPISIVNDSEFKISSNILHFNPIRVAGATFILDVTSNSWAQNEFVAVAHDTSYYFITNALGQGFYTTKFKNDGTNTILTLTSSLGTGNIDTVDAEQAGYFAIISASGGYKLINPSSLSYITNSGNLPTLTGDTYINITRNGNNAINASYKYFFMSRLGKIYSRNADYYQNHILQQNLATTLPNNYWSLFKYVHNVYVYISESGGVYSNSSPAITPNFKGNLFTNGGTNNSFAKSIYYFVDKFFVLTANGQLFTSLDLIEWSYQSQTVYNIFLADDTTIIYAISSSPAYNSNAILQFDSSSAVLIKSQDMEVMGINSDGDTTIYGYLNLEGGTSLNHSDLNNINGGTYHLSSSEYAKVQQLSAHNIGPPATGGATWSFIPVVEASAGIMEIGKYSDFHNISNDGIDYYARLYANTSNTLTLTNGTLNAATFSATGSMRAPLIKNNVSGGSLLYRNFADTTLMTIDNTGNVLIAGTLTQNGGSNTITHTTQSPDPTLEEGIFVETIGEIFYEDDFVRTYVRSTDDCRENENGETITETIPKNPYENCICKIKRALSLNKNIVGVLTSVNPVKFATHGDVLIKVISDTYNLGDILIPTIDGYGKKATSGEIYDSQFMMIPQ